MSDDTKICPACEQPYHSVGHIKRGMQWSDVYGGTVFDYFSKFHRQCRHYIDVETGEKARRGEVIVYTHFTPSGRLIA